jgi:hypothetical protein
VETYSIPSALETEDEFTSPDESQVRDQIGRQHAESEVPLGRDVESDIHGRSYHHEYDLGSSEERLAETGDLEEQPSGFGLARDSNGSSKREEMGDKPISGNDQLPTPTASTRDDEMGQVVHVRPGMVDQVQDLRTGTQTDGTGNQDSKRNSLSPVWANRFTSQNDDSLAKLEIINEVEKALEEGSVRDKFYLASWEWIQILHTVIRVSHRRKQWRIDPQPLIRPLLRNLERGSGDRVELARINLQAFAEALNGFTTDSALDMTELAKLAEPKEEQRGYLGILTQLE